MDEKDGQKGEFLAQGGTIERDHMTRSSHGSALDAVELFVCAVMPRCGQPDVDLETRLDASLTIVTRARHSASLGTVPMCSYRHAVTGSFHLVAACPAEMRKDGYVVR